ncbi:radical SAM protein [Pseudenhygromyxa sp. WMMC2535]|uniref:radical SAM protein n=1 Tax=Pseudenhygromyxa sp. WMMC2535 TaxID=2712867 RepID=UPI0015547647|nr:radical SAM protein [Pseudenhygromyxa sp. WMMC2535]
MPGLLDVILGYDCNLACDYCTISPSMRERSLDRAALLEAMRLGRMRDYDHIAFTGGEPTIRPDLVGLVRAARKLGFADVKVQSNGLLFTPGNIERLVAAGVSRFHVSIHSHREPNYDALVRRPGSFPLMAAGLRNAVASGLPTVVDLIVKADSMTDLPDAAAWIADHGVGEIHLWYVSLTDQNAENWRSLPPMRAAVPHMRAAMAVGRARGVVVKSLHVPRCLLGEDWTHAWDPGSQRVMVVTPEATFELSESRLAGQSRVPACTDCRFDDLCPGLRRDYLDALGDAEVAAVRGVSPSVRGKHHLDLL